MKRKNYIFILLLGIYVLLCISYSKVIGISYSYMGHNVTINISKILLSALIAFLMTVLGNLIKDDFYYCIYNILLVYYLYGELIFYQFNKGALITSPIIIVILLCFIFATKSIKFISPPYVYLSESKLNIILILLAFLLFAPFVFFYWEYIDIKNLFFIDVYKTRALFREISNRITGYSMAPLVRIILPVFIINSFTKKKYSFVLLGIGMILYVYLCGALKSVFMGLLAVVFFYKGKTYFDRISLFVKLLFSYLIIGLSAFTLFGNVFFLNFIRRIFFEPPLLANVYIKYFTNNYTYMSHSPFGLGIVHYPYDRPLSMYVGEIVMDSPGLNANVGIMLEGYIALGVMGAILFCGIMALIFVYIKNIDYDPKYFGILAIYIYYLNTSFISTLLLTHGLFFFLVFSYFFLRRKKKTYG